MNIFRFLFSDSVDNKRGIPWEAKMSRAIRTLTSGNLTTEALTTELARIDSNRTEEVAKAWEFLWEQKRTNAGWEYINKFCETHRTVKTYYPWRED